MLRLLKNRYVAGAAISAALFLCVWGYGKYQYQQGVRNTRAAARLEAFDQYQLDVESMTEASWDLQNIIMELQYAKSKVITQYRDRGGQVPLPDTCRIDDSRLRGIQSAIKAATASH